MATRAYLRLDPHLVDRKASYPDGALLAFVACLCHADQQPERGRFRNERLLKVLLERRARWIPYLLEHKDLVPLPDGRLYVDGWDEWQEGDVTVADRVARLRARRAANATPDVTPDVTVPVTKPVTRSRQTAAVRTAPVEAEAEATAKTKTREAPSSASPSHRARARGARPAGAGTPFLDLPSTDPRYPVAKLLVERFRWSSCSQAEWDDFAEEVDNEYPAGTKRGADPAVGWAWLAAELGKAPKSARDVKRWFFDRQRAAKGARLARAAADEARWAAEKQAGPTHPGLSTAAKQLAGRVDPKPNGKVTPAMRERAIAMLRESRGLLEEPMWRQLLGRYQLTEADLEPSR